MSDTKALQLAVRAIEGFRIKNADLKRQLAEARETLEAVRGRAKEARKVMERDIYLFAGDILTIVGESE